MKHWGRWLLFEQLLFFPKHVTLSEKMRLAWLVSIPLSLLTSSEVLSCTGGTVMSLGTLEKCHLLPERIPSFFEQNVLKAVGRTQIEGSYKVKTTWKLYPWSLASRSEEHLKHPDRWLLFACCKACDGVGEDEFALLASIPASCFFDRQTVSYFHAPKEQICHLICRRNPNLFRWEFPACWNRICLESCWQDTDRGDKNQGGCHTEKTRDILNPHFPRQSVNCYGRGNRGYCEYRLPEQKTRMFRIETE